MIYQFNIHKGNIAQSVTEYADYCEKVLEEIKQELGFDKQESPIYKLRLAEKSMIYTSELESLYYQCYGTFLENSFQEPTFFDLVSSSTEESFKNFNDQVDTFITNQVNFTNTLRQQALKS